MKKLDGGKERRERCTDGDRVGADAGVHEEFLEFVLLDYSAQRSPYRRRIPKVHFHDFPGDSQAVQHAVHIHLALLQVILEGPVFGVLEEEERIGLHQAQWPQDMTWLAEAEGSSVHADPYLLQEAEALHAKILTIKHIRVIQGRPMGQGMGLNVSVNSTLGGGLLLSLIALYGGNATGNQDLVDAATPAAWIFGALWAAFVLLSLFRNIRSL